jgi:hypothetical protein
LGRERTASGAGGGAGTKAETLITVEIVFIIDNSQKNEDDDDTEQKKNLRFMKFNNFFSFPAFLHRCQLLCWLFFFRCSAQRNSISIIGEKQPGEASVERVREEPEVGKEEKDGNI